MGESRHLEGRWRVAVTTSPSIRNDTVLSLTAHPDGLELGADGADGRMVPWGLAAASVDPLSELVTLELGAGTSVAVWPIDGADPQALIAAIRDGQAVEATTGRRHSMFREHPAGPDRILVVYPSGDTGEEIDADAFLAAVAADAELRAANGWTLVSLVALPVRHAGVKMFGVEGSGYTTKAAVGGLYARS